MRTRIPAFRVSLAAALLVLSACATTGEQPRRGCRLGERPVTADYTWFEQQGEVEALMVSTRCKRTALGVFLHGREKAP